MARRRVLTRRASARHNGTLCLYQKMVMRGGTRSGLRNRRRDGVSGFESGGHYRAADAARRRWRGPRQSSAPGGLECLARPSEAGARDTVPLVAELGQPPSMLDVSTALDDKALVEVAERGAVALVFQGWAQESRPVTLVTLATLTLTRPVSRTSASVLTVLRARRRGM